MRLYFFFVIIFVSLLSLSACSNKAPIEPLQPVSNEGEKAVIAAGTVILDIETMSVIPVDNRDAAFHYDVTSLLRGACPGGCFKWRILSWVAQILTIELKLENPVAIQVYDVRIVFTYLDQKTVENPDGYTDVFHAGQVNPFIAFAKSSPIRAFPIGPGGIDIQNLVLKWASGGPNVSYFIEVSIGGNCKEPYLIHDQIQIGELTPSGGNATIHVEVSDHQDDVTSVLVNTTPITGSIASLSQISGEIWEKAISNTSGAAPGEYKCLIAASSSGETVKLYDYIVLSVTESISEAWDSFGGNRRNTGNTDIIGPQTNHIQWFNDHTFTGDYHTIGAPVIDSNGDVYYHYVPHPTNGIFYKVRGDNGVVMWTHDPDLDDGDVANKEMYNVPALDEDAGYVYYACTGGIWCVEMSSGEHVNHCATQGLLDLSSPTVASAQTAQKCVFVGSTDPEEGLMCFYSGLSGNKYIFGTTNGVGTTPSVDSTGNAFFPSLGTGKKFHGLNATGVELFTPLTLDSEAKRLVSSAIDDDGTIYYQTSGYKLYALNPSGSIKWNFFNSTPNDYYTSPAIGHGDNVYIFREKILYAVKKENGSENWNYSVNEFGITPIVDGGETLYFMTYNGKIYAFDTVSRTYKWTYDTTRPLSTYVIYRYPASGALGPDGLLVFCGKAGVWAFKDL